MIQVQLLSGRASRPPGFDGSDFRGAETRLRIHHPPVQTKPPEKGPTVHQKVNRLIL